MSNLNFQSAGDDKLFYCVYKDIKIWTKQQNLILEASKLSKNDLSAQLIMK